MQPGDATLSAYNTPSLFISETANGGGTNTVVLAGTTPANTTMWTDYQGDLFVKYTSTDVVEITDGQSGTHASIVGQYVQQIAFFDGTLWNLTGGLHLTANSIAPTIYGTAVGGDTLDGSGITGAVLHASTGTETLIAGPSSTLDGGSGTNLYVINADSSPGSSGGSTINPNTSATGDQVVLHGVTQSQVKMYDDSSGNLMISTANGDLATIAGGSYSGTNGVTLGNVSELTFDNGSHVSLTGVVPLTSVSGHGTLYGVSTGTDFISGGVGCTFDGFNSNDVFSFSSGSSPTSNGGSTIEENATGGGTIAFSGISPSAVTISDDTAGNLTFHYTSTDTVTIAGSFSSTNGLTIGNVSQVTFDDANHTVWNLTGGVDLTATGNGQHLYGTSSGGDTLTAAGVNEYLNAYGGTETLVAGAGAYLYNGTGTDTDVFTAGASPISNDDWVVANTSGGTAIIDLHGINPTAVTMWDDTSGHLCIQYSSTDVIEVFGGSYSSSTGVTLPSGEIAFDSSYSTTWNLGTGLDLMATSNGQSLYGTTSGGDTLTAAGVNENLYAFGGTETLVAGVGVTLNNGTGTDTDVFTAGASPTSNEDWIMANASGTGIINLSGINPTAVTVWDDTGGHLWVQYSSTDVIEVFGGSYSSSTGFHVAGISEITFDSSYGTTWNMTGGLNLTATHDSQSLSARAMATTWTRWEIAIPSMESPATIR